MNACMAEPFLVAGDGRADVALMQAAPGRVFVKTGAEGVYCAAVPELGLGVAIKCEDGAGRGAEVMVAAVLAKLLKSDTALSSKLLEIARPPIESRIGAKVGTVRPTAALY
jgi:L-asparaginase II